ncbi:MAG TPA: c-type cytochrome, partial [Chthoniobacteraceae bacterium]
TVDRGTSAALTEYRVWDVARTPEEILANYQRSFAEESLPAHLVRYFSGAGPWGKLDGQAHVMRTRDFPELLDPASAKALEAKFARFRQLIAAPGDSTRGHALFVATCEVCHRAKGEGAQIGPELSGAGAMGDESLLRNILTPNERIESGYYRFDVELKSGDLLTGFFVREDPSGVVIRPIGADDRTIPRSEIRNAKMARKSIMPEGLLDVMPEKDVADLFDYLRSLH